MIAFLKLYDGKVREHISKNRKHTIKIYNAWLYVLRMFVLWLFTIFYVLVSVCMMMIFSDTVQYILK